MAGARRRSNGEGSVFKLPNGKWRAQMEIPQSPGRKRRRVVRHFDTKTEATAGLRQMQAVKSIPHSNRPLREHLADWLSRGERAPATEASKS